MRERKTELITKLPEVPAAAALSSFGLPSLSDNGRMVAFQGDPKLLGLSDTTLDRDILVSDRKTGATTIASVDSDGVQGGGDPYCPSLSGNGRFATFTSQSSVYDERDKNVTFGDAFIHDLRTGKTEIVSIASDGEQPDGASPSGNSGCQGGNVSRDGQIVSFGADGPGMVPNDTNEWLRGSSGFDVFVHDRKTVRTERVSVNSFGEEWPSKNPLFSTSGDGLLSSDGRYAIFLGPVRLAEPRSAEDQIPVFSAPHRTGFIYDRRTFTLERLAAPAGDDGNCDGTYQGTDPLDVVPGGRYIPVRSCPDASSRRSDSENINPNDLFLLDRGASLTASGSGKGDLRSAPAFEGLSSLTRNGFASVTDQSDVLISQQIKGSDVIEVDVAYRPSLGDLFFNIDIDYMPGPRTSLATAGNPLLLYGVSFVYDGRAYELRIAKDGLTPRFGLFSCSAKTCSETASLRGGYGTMGDSVAVSLPLTEIGFHGGALGKVTAFSSLGSYDLGAKKILDRVLIKE